MPDLYPFIGLIILHVVISGSSLILHKVFEKQEKITTDATNIDGIMKEEDIALKVDILGMYAIFCRSLFGVLSFFFWSLCCLLIVNLLNKNVDIYLKKT